MNKSDEDRIKGFLIGVMSDGFNRSLGALEEANAVNADKMRTQYKGIGSKYYDIVTEQLEYTAKSATPELLKFLNNEKESNNE